MHWRRVDPVQAVDALLLIGDEASARLDAALLAKPAFARSLPFAVGVDWAALFGRPLQGEDQPVLPRIAGAIPLYRAQPGWWFPVGSALDVPDSAQAELLKDFARHAGWAPPVIIVPRFGSRSFSCDVDAYPVHLRDPVSV